MTSEWTNDAQKRARLLSILKQSSLPSKEITASIVTGELPELPEITRLEAVPQDAKNHPEGNVLIHTMQVIDRAAAIRPLIKEEHRAIYMLAALLHDVGKYTHTYYKMPGGKLIQWQMTDEKPDGSRIVAYGHDIAGGPIAESVISRLMQNGAKDFALVPKLVALHMRPFLMSAASDRAFRKLLTKHGEELITLVYYLNWADKGKESREWLDHCLNSKK